MQRVCYATVSLIKEESRPSLGYFLPLLPRDFSGKFSQRIQRKRIYFVPISG